MQGKDTNRAIPKMVTGDLQILQPAENCYWTVLAYSIAHRIAQHACKIFLLILCYRTKIYASKINSSFSRGRIICVEDIDWNLD